MQIKPVASANAIQQAAPSDTQAVRAKAIAAFNQSASPQPEQKVVQNQNSIQPEELSAIQTGQEHNTEEPQEVTEAPAPVKEEDPVLSRQFAQLARQEKALRARSQQQDQQFKAREQSLNAREAELKQQPQIDRSKYVSIEDLKSDPWTYLGKAEVNYEQLTQDVINQQPTDPRVQRTISQLQQQIQELRQANEDGRKSQADSQTQAYQAAVKQISLDVKTLVRSDDNFEAIRATNSVRDVVDLIEQTYHKDGVLLTVEDAAQQVEDYLVEEATKLTRLQKIQRRLQTVAPKAASSTAQTLAGSTKQTQPMKTLTNATSSSRQLSAKERAILAFKGELKS